MRTMLMVAVVLLLGSNAFGSWTVDSISYERRKKITTQYANVDSNLTDFPLLVPISSDTDIGGNTNSDGHDIRFTQSNGSTEISYERVHHTVTGGSLDAIYWVEVPTVSSSGDTDIYIYYRSDDTADGEDASGVWNSSFKGVFHLPESSGDAIDSTSNSNDGTFNGNLPDVGRGGKIYKGQDADGAGDYVQAGTSTDFAIEGDMTFSCWCLNDASPFGNNVLTAIEAGTGESTNENSVLYLYVPSGGDMIYIHEYGSGSNESNTFNTNLSTATWYHIYLTRDVSANDVDLWVNGSYISNFSYSNDPDNNGTAAYFAMAGRSSGGAMEWDGIIEEFRVSDSDRGADWGKFEYYNANEADNELTWGSEEEAPAASGTAAQVLGTGPAASSPLTQEQVIQDFIRGR